LKGCEGKINPTSIREEDMEVGSFSTSILGKGRGMIGTFQERKVANSSFSTLCKAYKK